MSFLSAVAQYYVDRLESSQWEKTVFVFPNQRSGVFFANTLCSVLGENGVKGPNGVIFGLNITTLGDLLRKGSDFAVADQVTLRCELYKAYVEVEDGMGASNNESEGTSSRKRRHDFDSFYSWAGIIINDFSDIDRALVDPVKIYSNITSLQQLSDEMDYLSDRQREAIERFWHILFEEKTDAMGDKKLVHRRFVEDFRKMDALYRVFRNRLKEQDLVYPAMLLRDAAENPLCWSWDEDDVRYVFIGFSLLCPAEERIMRRLRNMKTADGLPRADFFWDYQNEMLHESPEVGKHGAGYAIKKWVLDPDLHAPKDFTVPAGVKQKEQEIVLVETAYPLSQAAVVSDILQKRIDTRKVENCVIVLPDQQMLLPVISAIPDSVTDINVTMGYDLRFSNVSSFVRLIADIFNPMWLRRRHDDGATLFNTRVVLPFLRHPYVIRCDGLDATRRVVKTIIDGNMAFVSHDDMSGLQFTSSVFGILLKFAKSFPVMASELPVDVLCDSLHSVFVSIYNTFANEGDRSLDRETIWEVLKVVRRLSVVFQIVKDDINDVRMLLRIFCSMVDQQNVDFQGMPLGGLQIMGVLETRALDFNDVIILDMNEGSWPPPRLSVNTMIPLFLRRANNMTTPDDIDSTYNYYFYRLKSRAKNVVMVRPTCMTGTRQSQLSRYVMQVEKIYGQQIETLSAQRPVMPRERRRIEIDKHTIADVLMRNPLSEQLGLRGFKISPTGFGDYVECPLKFYFKRIVGLRVEDDISEDADVRQLGLIYHGVMEQLYKPKAVKLTSERLDLLKSKAYEPNIERLIIEQFCEVMNAKHVKSFADLNGRNLLTFIMLKRLVMLTVETEQVGTVIVDTEENVDNLVINLPSGRTAVLNGSIDRQHIAPSIDGNGRYYVADYKTGEVKKMKIDSLADLFDEAKHADNKAILQVMMYCYFLRHKQDNPVKGPMSPYVIRVRNLLDDKIGMSTWVNNGTEANPDRIARIANTIIDDKGKEKKVYDPIEYSGEIEAEFERLLAEKIDEIYDVDVPFRQAESYKGCEKCDFNNICKR